MSGKDANERTAVAWFGKDTYATDRELMVDSRYLPTTWEAWHRSIESQLAALVS